MIELTIVTIARYNDADLDRTIKSIDYSFGNFLRCGRVDNVVVCAEKLSSEKNKEGRSLYYSKPNGIYNAMNVGLSKATGKWVWFLNAGDVANEGICEELLLLLNESESQLLMTGIIAVNGADERKVFGKMTSPHPGTFCNTLQLKAINGYREDFKIISDRVAFDTLRKKNIKIEKSNLVVAKFYEDGISSSEEGIKIKKKECLKHAFERPFDLLRWFRYFRN